MTPGSSLPATVKVGSGLGLAVGGLAFFATLFNYAFDPTRRANVPGYWSNLYDIQARALLDGHLSVPTGSLGIEGIVHDGQTHMYFPLFPALLRLPVLLTTREFDGRLTLLSMALAWIVFATMTTRLFWLVRSVVIGSGVPSRLHAAFAATVIAAATGGTTLTFDAAQPWVYNEAYVWGVAAALGAMYWMVRTLTDGETMSVRWLGAFVLLAVLTRPTEGWAVGLVTLAVAAWVGSGRVPNVDRRLWWRVLLAGLLPLAVGIVISEVKFGTVYLHPLGEQVWTSLNAHRRAALEANGGSLTGPQFFLTGLVAYFRPDGIRFVDYFPWITLPADPAQAYGHAIIDQTYRTGSVTSFMPMLLVLTGFAAVLLLRPRRRAERILLPPLVAGVLVTGGVMGYGYYSMRYVSDFVPALVFGGCVGVALLLRAVDSRHRLGISALGVLVAATVFSTLAHMAVGYSTAAVSTGGSRLRAYVQHQVTLSGDTLSGRVTVSDRIPSHERGGMTDELVVVDDCKALYLNTGDAYRPWVAVAARDLVVSFTGTDAPTAPGNLEVFKTSSGAIGTLETRTDGRGRVVLEPPPDSPELDTVRGDWGDLAGAWRSASRTTPSWSSTGSPPRPGVRSAAFRPRSTTPTSTTPRSACRP